MRKFFAQLSISILGTLLALSILTGLVIVSISGKKEKQIESNSVLTLNFSGELPELTGNISMQGIPGTMGSGTGIFETKELLAKAGKDEKIKALYLELNDIHLPQAKVLLLADAVKQFKSSGKPVYAFADNYNQHAYLLSSVADSVFVNPLGNIEVKGYGYGSPFYTRLMEKLGLHYEIYYAGDFKGATEPFRLHEFSEKNSMQWRTYLKKLHTILVEEIANNRRIDPKEIEQYINEGNTLNPLSGLQSGLVDGLLYRDQMESLLKEKLHESTLKFVDLARYKAFNRDKNKKASDKIAVVFMEGEITSSASGYGVIDLKNYQEIFQKIQDDPHTKAVVLRINSGGGDGQVSDALAHQIKAISDKGVPVICSMGTYAASGGYYVAANADYIIAEKSCLTGSIGVFVMFPQVEEFLENTASIFFDTLQTSDYANGYSPFYNLTDGQKKRFQQLTDDLYFKFKQVVANGRNMSLEKVDSLAGGRIWTADSAYTNGLIDTIGNYDLAVDKAVKLSGISTYELNIYPEIKKSKWEEIVLQLASKETNLKSVLQKQNSILTKLDEQIDQINSVKVKASTLPFQIQ